MFTLHLRLARYPLCLLERQCSNYSAPHAHNNPISVMTWALCSNQQIREGKRDAAGRIQRLRQTESVRSEERGAGVDEERRSEIITEWKENSGWQLSTASWISNVRACYAAASAFSSAKTRLDPPPSLQRRCLNHIEAAASCNLIWWGPQSHFIIQVTQSPL